MDQVRVKLLFTIICAKLLKQHIVSFTEEYQRYLPFHLDSVDMRWIVEGTLTHM